MVWYGIYVLYVWHVPHFGLLCDLFVQRNDMKLGISIIMFVTIFFRYCCCLFSSRSLERPSPFARPLELLNSPGFSKFCSGAFPALAPQICMYIFIHTPTIYIYIVPFAFVFLGCQNVSITYLKVAKKERRNGKIFIVIFRFWIRAA